MEPKMISLKVLSTAAAIALVASMASESFAQSPSGARQGAIGGRAGGGGGGGAVAPRFNGGGGGGVRIGGDGAPSPTFSGGGVYRGGGGGGGYYRHGGGGGGFIPGAVAGAIVGGAIASQGYYGGPGYYTPGPGYYDEGYVDDGAVAVETAPGGDDVAYCSQRYRSYDPRSGTYLGNDGLRHPCP
jgi:hypothetical protein